MNINRIRNKYVGRKYNKLTINSVYRNDYAALRAMCLCECGKIKDIGLYNVVYGSTKSCGCLNLENVAKLGKNLATNHTGIQYGRLTAIRPIEYVRNRRGVVWECICTCGNYKNVVSSQLESGAVVSCGCLAEENKARFSNIVGCDSGTILSRLNDNININNKSGTRGVSYDRSRNKWKAYITYKSKLYNLGRFSDKEKAISARKQAEDELWGADREKIENYFSSLKSKREEVHINGKF